MNILFKITKYGFYSGVESEQYIVIAETKIKSWFNAYLLLEYGNIDYNLILSELRNNGYFKGVVLFGLGDLEICNLGKIKLHI